MADIRIDDGQLKDIIAKSILDTLTPEKREALIGAAVKSLLTESVGSGYGSPTKIQSAFNDAVYRVAQEIAVEHCNQPETRAKIQKVVADATARAFGLGGEDHEALVEKIANSIRRGITGERY